ncbi:3'-5' exonuclease [Litchfieldia salsa]|uniref:Inhibitor of the KinA pathway to sporulation, predicted exonuclease n=1 Tax=Litchfieldia salsa TaxID=930152 RepID=A0A1H0TCD4_9BACI|nr:3'-5' exonuclease [Litchfieldia salsa]SDP51515.1 Inhibitor of the KinA pathway to sporulation, predicted exonuclease [Litchfieldia salsa]
MAEVKQFVFFDFEMLCSDKGMSFSSMESIRLGAVKYQIETETIDYFDCYIKPIHFKGLSSFCKKLTGIVDEDLKEAQDFKEVFEQFLDWIGGIKKTRFFSWSKSDLSRLKLDAELHQISGNTIKKIEKRYVDFQEIFTKRVTKTQYSVENALLLYGLEFIGAKHNPMFDAYNTLRIYLAFLSKPIQTDLVMLRQFVFIELDHELTPSDDLNSMLNTILLNELSVFMYNLSDIYTMKDFSKVLRATRKLVEKYENVICNRSGMFSKRNINLIRRLVAFYHELLLAYQEHSNHSSKIIILSEHIKQPIEYLSLKRG